MICLRREQDCQALQPCIVYAAHTVKPGRPGARPPPGEEPGDRSGCLVLTAGTAGTWPGGCQGDKRIGKANMRMRVEK